MIRWNKKIAVQYLQEMRSPIEEQMMAPQGPPALQKLMAMPRQMKVQVGGNGGNQPQAG